MRRVLALVLVVVVSGIAGPAMVPAAGEVAVSAPVHSESPDRQAPLAGDGPATSHSVADTLSIDKDVRLFLTPDNPGAVDVSVTYDVPDELTSLSVQLPSDAKDVRTNSFTEGEEGYEWDESTELATIQFSMPANESIDGSRSMDVADSRSGLLEASQSLQRGQDGQLAFVDTGDWALVSVPQLSTSWGWRNGGKVTLTESVSVDEEGSTGGEIAYLGPVETHTRTVNDQAFTLVVPAAASLREEPNDLLDALSGASERLRIGTRDVEVWFVAAPTDAPWGVHGVEYGGSDAWVVADSSLDDPGNVWLHEYVHTRQEFQTAKSARWIIEGSAEYYSALLALRGGYVSFEQFETYLEHGEHEPWRNAVLADPSTWEDGANYVKGSLVVGELDRQIRMATDSSATMSEVLWVLNRHADEVTNGEFLQAVTSASNDSVASDAERFTESEATPRTWMRQTHEAAFESQPPRMEHEIESYRVTGPFRNESFDSLPPLYVGESLTVETVASNDGGTTGSYSTTLTRGGDTVESEGTELAPGESSVVNLRHEFDTAGDYTLLVGRTQTPVTVADPASVTVKSIAVSETSVSEGDSVTVTVELSNPSDRLARGSVAVTLAGEAIGNVNAVLSPGTTATRTLTVTAKSNDSAVLAAGNESMTLNPGERGSGGAIPGFGAAVVVLAVALAVTFATRER